MGVVEQEACRLSSENAVVVCPAAFTLFVVVLVLNSGFFEDDDDLARIEGFYEAIGGLPGHESAVRSAASCEKPTAVFPFAVERRSPKFCLTDRGNQTTLGL